MTRLDPHEVHALAVAVANALLDEALDVEADLDMPMRRGVLREAARALAEMARA